MFCDFSHIACQIEQAKMRQQREEADLARLKSLPPAEAQVELMHRQTLALERKAAQPRVTQVNVRSSIF